MSDTTTDTRAARFASQTHTAGTHPRRAHIHATTTLGERAADALAALVGSWRFVIAQNVLVLVWIAFNVVAIFGWRWDPYPFILLNLAFSWQASNTGPILQLSSNRQAAKDRARDDTEAAEVEQLTAMNEQQLVILHELRAQGAKIAALEAMLRAASTASVKDPKTGKFVSRKSA